MAQKGALLDRDTFSCSICLDLLKEPVTIPCGHSYCMSCINNFWDGKDQRIYSCPQCRQTFTQRPVLVKSTMLATLVEQLKKTGLQAAAADHCYAGPEDVACDVCNGRKLKALKSCLVCLASYCENHLQPHYDAAPLKKHKLVDPSEKIQRNICSRHDEVMKIFCRTDQQSICYLCSMDEHKGHDTVSAAAERTERQRELEVSRQNIQQRIQDREKDVKLLQQEVETVDCSANKAAEDSEKIFTELIRLLQKRSSDVKQQIRSRQETEVSRVKELQEKLQQEISELKKKDAELKQLSHTEDHNQFLHNYPSLSQLSESSSINICPQSYFEDVTAAVSKLRDQIQDILSRPVQRPLDENVLTVKKKHTFWQAGSSAASLTAAVQGCAGGLPVVSQRKASGGPLEGQWKASGGPLEGQWKASGGPLEGQWKASGGRVECQWKASGGPVESQQWASRRIQLVPPRREGQRHAKQLWASSVPVCQRRDGRAASSQPVTGQRIASQRWGSRGALVGLCSSDSD